MNGKYCHSMGTIIDPSSLGVGGFEKVKFAYPKSEYNARVFNTYDEIPEKIEDELIEKLKTMGKLLLLLVRRLKQQLYVIILKYIFIIFI